MRILFVHTIGKNKYGGGERWVVNAAYGLQKKGHEVYVVSKPNSILLKKASEKGINTICFNIVSNLSLYHAFLLSRIIRNNKIDVVFSKGRDLAVAGLASKWGGKPLVIRRTGSPPRRKFRKHVFLTKWLADGVITNTKSISGFYIDNGFPENSYVKVIYNGLLPDDDIPAFDFKDIYPGRTIALCVGRLVAAKGYYYLIDALPELKKSNPDVLFYVLGDGKEKAKLIRYARKKGVDDMIYFGGYIDSSIPYYKGCNLFVHPSLFEGMPNAAMEAMAYGKPVILTNVNGAEELSCNGKYAWLIPPANSNAITRSVIQAMQNKVELYRMGEQAKYYVREKFSTQTMINSLEDFINNCLKKKQINNKF